jgi:hypothetical protein
MLLGAWKIVAPKPFLSQNKVVIFLVGILLLYYDYGRRKRL